MSWKDVGNWIKDNAGNGAKLVGSLLVGGPPAAIATAVSLVSGATGTDDPVAALQTLQNDPQSMVKLKGLYFQNEADVRRHLETMTRLSLEDRQSEHQTTQATVQAGDKAADRFVRWTRPGQSWVSLIAALIYANSTSPNTDVLLLLLALPWAYAGLRQAGKITDTIMTKKSSH